MLAARRFAVVRSGLVGRCLVPRLPGVSARYFSAYEGQDVTDEQLVKKSDDWAIEETNFCLGRVSFTRFKETDDLARRTQHLMDCQLSKQHTRLRDGTVIPFTAMFLDDIVDKPGPCHIFTEMPLLKWTWDETYDEAYEKPSGAM
eukprot:TRINITY_DN3801_c0_g1_i1.p2 TRINITY_DN3801_c0_g1~~TRINITY_DN3801_c0_g1_i1.p2  ORF type:complete len:145 (+),score=22.57 TRINITY_DN3801_c0_g1_i1:67-501(+)